MYKCWQVQAGLYIIIPLFLAVSRSQTTRKHRASESVQIWNTPNTHDPGIFPMHANLGSVKHTRISILNER